MAGTQRPPVRKAQMFHLGLGRKPYLSGLHVVELKIWGEIYYFYLSGLLTSLSNFILTDIFMTIMHILQSAQNQSVQLTFSSSGPIHEGV